MKTTLLPIVAALVRHALTLASGWLAARDLPGLTDGTIRNLGDLAGAAVLAAVAIAWSAFEKLSRKPDRAP